MKKISFPSRGSSVMRRCAECLLIAAAFLTLFATDLFCQNPLVLDQFTADPAARVFDGKVYLYPSHDILAKDGHGRPGWFCMEDYHVFSSSNLVDWTDHGVIVRQDSVPWVNPKLFAMWAPDCVYRNGKYYFYFPAPARDTTYGRGFSIGVAVSETPYGPFTPQPAPIKGVHGIDPNPFIDKDGQAYLCWAARNFVVAKLKDNMLELAGEPQVVKGLPDSGLKEGPYLFERRGIYYLTYPHVQNKSERLEYAIGNSPAGPFVVKGVIMDETPDCWTNQCSVIEFNQQWYLFYHHSDLSPHFDKNRSVRMDSLFFNEDGTIKKVIPTLRGVGVSSASKRIQIDRYSRISDNGASVTELDTLHRSEGWKTTFDAAHAWIQYNSVDFGERKPASIDVRAASETGCTLRIMLESLTGPVIGEIVIPKGTAWSVVNAPLKEFQPGLHNLIVQMKDEGSVDVDWITFK
ncbi:MAG TPA: family 43 glycosylhydrolase [Bacteroidota bacterium]|nr:family 43 glycosylhydrolase [Bacteroidota bacterium]